MFSFPCPKISTPHLCKALNYFVIWLCLKLESSKFSPLPTCQCPVSWTIPVSVGQMNGFYECDMPFSGAESTSSQRLFGVAWGSALLDAVWFTRMNYFHLFYDFRLTTVLRFFTYNYLVLLTCKWIAGVLLSVHWLQTCWKSWMQESC